MTILVIGDTMVEHVQRDVWDSTRLARLRVVYVRSTAIIHSSQREQSQQYHQSLHISHTKTPAKTVVLVQWLTAAQTSVKIQRTRRRVGHVKAVIGPVATLGGILAAHQCGAHVGLMEEILKVALLETQIGRAVMGAVMAMVRILVSSQTTDTQ